MNLFIFSIKINNFLGIIDHSIPIPYKKNIILIDLSGICVLVVIRTLVMGLNPGRGTGTIPLGKVFTQLLHVHPGKFVYPIFCQNDNTKKEKTERTIVRNIAAVLLCSSNTV